MMTASSSELTPVAGLTLLGSVPVTTIRSPTDQPVVATPAGTVNLNEPGTVATPLVGFGGAILLVVRVNCGSVIYGVTASPVILTVPCEIRPRANCRGSSSVSNGLASENFVQS